MKGALIGKNFGLRRGSGTLEILIAFAILMLAITAAVTVAFGSQRLTVDTELGHQAFYKASRELDLVRADALTDFDAVSSSPAVLLTSGEGDYNGIYTSQIDVVDVDPCTKEIISRINWQTEPLRPQEVKFATWITSTSTLGAMGGAGCSASPAVDWSNPGTLGSSDLDEPGVKGTDIAVTNKIAFLTGGHSDSKKPDFFIVKTTSTPPQVLSSLDTTIEKLNAVVAADGYAYVANASSSNQLQVINVSDTADPQMVASTTLPGVTQDGRSLFYFNSRLYIGTDADGSGAEFHVYDVATPANPAWLGSKEIGADVNSIFVRGTTAYLATSGDNQEVLVLNVNNPGSIPAPIRTLDMPGNQDARTLYLLGPKLYVGRNEGAPEFYVLDTTNPAIGLPTLGTAPAAGDILDLQVNGPYAFVITNKANKEFQILNITNPDRIAQVISGNCNSAQFATGIYFESNIVYLSTRSNYALRLIAPDPNLPAC